MWTRMVLERAMWGLCWGTGECSVDMGWNAVWVAAGLGYWRVEGCPASSFLETNHFIAPACFSHHGRP